MSATLHQIYQSKALVLTKTMVVKLHTVALAINADLRSRGYEVNESDPTTWKYYLNLAGEYHQADYDRLSELSGGEHDHIRIKVAGDNQPIEVNFTKGLLFGDRSDLAVANEYRFNTQYYNSLITKYPEFEMLILGVLNPVPLDISTSSVDGEILYCGGYLKTRLSTGIYHYIRQDYGPISENFLIESNEENLISYLQDYIYSFIGRWQNVNYNQTSELFYPIFLAHLFLNIPNMLGAIRIGNAKSPMTHSFHIREYLDSFGKLGWVVDHLQKKELLWIYRNLMWLDANKGKQMTFKAIVDNVLTPSNIPLAGHRLEHDLTDMGEVDEDGVYHIVAKPFMQRDTINIKHTGTGSDYREIRHIIEKEQTLAIENYYDQAGQSERTSNVSKFSMFDSVNTKVLESTVIDTTNRIPFTMEDIGLNLWVFTASRGTYRGTILVTHPLTNDRLQLTPLNAYILALYCLNKGWANYDLETIPLMYADWIPRLTNWSPGEDFPVKGTFEDYRGGTLKKNLDDSVIVDIMGNFIPSFNHNSAASLNAEITKQHAEIMRRYFTYCKVEDAVGRGHAEWVSHQQYWYNVPCVLRSDKPLYKDWLLAHGIELDGFTQNDYVTLGLALVEASTGIDLTASQKLKDKQSAALAVLRHFSSYTIQIIQDVVAVDSFTTNGKTLRVTNDKAKLKDALKVKLPLTTAKDDWSIKEGPIWLGDIHLTDNFNVREEFKAEDQIDLSVKLNVGKVRSHERTRLNYTTITKANIPTIVVDHRVKVYAALTTFPYEKPNYAALTTVPYATIVDEVIDADLSTGDLNGFITNVPPNTNAGADVATAKVTVNVSKAAVTSDQAGLTNTMRFDGFVIRTVS